MPAIITEDDLVELEFSVIPPKRRADALRARVETLIAWATSDEYVLEPGLTPAELLATAADHALSIDDVDLAGRLADRIDSVPREGECDAEIIRIEIALRRGDVDRARAMSDGVRRAGRLGQSVCLRLGELFEEFGELPVAERWFTIGARDCDGDARRETERMLSLTARARVRRTAGKPEDGLDEENRVLRLTRFGLGDPEWEN